MSYKIKVIVDFTDGESIEYNPSYPMRTMSDVLDYTKEFTLKVIENFGDEVSCVRYIEMGGDINGKQN